MSVLAACLFYVVCNLVNLAVGAYILLQQNRDLIAGSTLETVLATQEANLVACLVSFLIGLVFLRSTFEALDSPEVNKMFHDLRSIAVVDSIVFDAVLTCALVAPILCLFFGGNDRHLYYILLDSSEIFIITGGLFLFRTIRYGDEVFFQHIVYLALLGSQLHFYLGLGIDPTPMQLWHTRISGWLHFAGLAAIVWSEYFYDWKRTLENVKTGRLFEFNTAENICLCYNIYNVMIYVLHWSIVLVMWWNDSTQTFSYLNYSHNTIIAFLVPCLVVQVAVLVTPKRIDERTKRLLAQIIVSKSNQSAEMLSLSRKYLAEKQKHRQLLERMLPARVINELQQTGSFVPERMDDVTILFCDLVGFTNLAATLDAIETAELLNGVYQLFDKVVERDPRLYKIETVGDEFMVCSGAPYECEDHYCAIADLALLLLRVIELFLVPSHDEHDAAAVVRPLRIRTGIHSGPVVGAVMGSSMPRYTLVGDTVNTASRMESTGLPDRVQVSSATAMQLQKTGKYVLEQRGEIDVKGKGSMQTHWLVSASSLHDTINEAFLAEFIGDLRSRKLKAEREAEHMTKVLSDDSVSTLSTRSDFNESKKRVLLLASSSSNEAKDNCKDNKQCSSGDIVDSLLERGYLCTVSSTTTTVSNAHDKPDILLVDLDSFDVNISNLAFTTAFQGPVILMKSLTFEQAATKEENRLLLFKPFDVEAFDRIVSNLY